MAASAGSGASASMTSSIPLDPEQAKKDELEGNADFKKILKALKMGVSSATIR